MPEQFGKYSLLGHLATGGMAEVYLARQGGLQGFEKIVVIKRVRPEMTDRMTTQLFLDEARLVATLEHPNIAQVYEMDMVGDAYFFVMEYVHGADLRQLMEALHKRNRTIPLADAIYIAIGISAALHYAHEKTDRDGQPLDIIHRDVSPSNVLISHDGAVKVCDFGIAKASNRSAETERGVLKGKYSYMSPEQCQSQDIDRRSDIFALGILLYEMTTLSRLFNGSSDFELLRSIVEEPVPPPSARTADYPPELERIVLRALERDPEDRYATAQEMQLELEAFAREHKLAMSSVSIKKLMGSLFEKRIEAWLRSQQSGKALGDHLLETVRRPSGELPIFLPLGSEEYDVTVDQTPGKSLSMREKRRSQPIATTPPVTPAPEPSRKPNVLWIVLAILAGGVAAGVTVVDSYLRDTQKKEALKELDNDAERVGNALDGTVRSLQMRAQTIASTPMLRAAIETDAETVADLAKNEYVFAPAKGETIEVFQLANGNATSMVRMPREAAPIPPVKQAQETRFEPTKDGLVAVAAAPIAGSMGVAGALAISKAVDLSMLRQTIGKHSHHASLVGLSSEVELVSGDADATLPLQLSVPVSSEWGTSPLVLSATPPTVTQMPWVVPVRYASAGGAALFLLLYVLGLRRSRG